MLNKIKYFTVVLSVVFSSGLATAQISSATQNIPETFKTSLQKMFTEYLELEDALMKGDAKSAAHEAVEVNDIASKINTQGLAKDQVAAFTKQNEKILHNTEHIRDNPTNYPHQCEHFDYLTDEFYALLKTFQLNASPVYYNYTKEGNEGNSGHWLTDKDDMKDPYFKGAIKSTDKRIETLK